MTTRYPQRSDSPRSYALGHSPTAPRVLAFAALLMIVAAPHLATAQFSVNAIFIDDAGDRLSESELDEFFNRALCNCGSTGSEVGIEVEINAGQSDKEDDLLFVVAGDDCLDSENRIDETECTVLHETTEVDQVDQDIRFTAGVRQLMGDDCDRVRRSLSITVYTGQKSEAIKKGEALQYTVDGDPPTAPAKGPSEPQPGEKLITVSFEEGSDSESDVFYQLLCEKDVDGQREPWIDSDQAAKYTAAFVDESTVCSADSTGATDATAGSEDADLLAEPRYLCSSKLTGAGSQSIRDLEDGTTYYIYVVSVDKSGNASEPVSLGSATPAPSEDLWERYKAVGGTGTGCRVGDLGGSGAPIAGLLLWTLLIGRRRRNAARHACSRENRR